MAPNVRGNAALQSALPDAEPEQVEAWIAQNKDNLPTTYDEIIRLPYQYRMRVFASLAPAQKSELWKTQIERYRRQHTLTREQQEVLERASASMSPEAYAPTGGNEAEDRGLREAAIKAFGFTEARALFTRLGPDEPAPTDGDPQDGK